MPATQTVPGEDTDIGIRRANHIGIAVRDLDRSIAFYTAIAGAEVAIRDMLESDRLAETSGLDEASIRYATLRLGNLNIDLLEFERPPMDDAQYQPNNAGGVHFCFEVDDLDAVRSRLEEAGIDFTGPTYTVGEVDDGSDERVAGTRFAYFDGPDGEHLEIIEPKGAFERSERMG